MLCTLATISYIITFLIYIHYIITAFVRFFFSFCPFNFFLLLLLLLWTCVDVVGARVVCSIFPFYCSVMNNNFVNCLWIFNRKLLPSQLMAVVIVSGEHFYRNKKSFSCLVLLFIFIESIFLLLLLFLFELIRNRQHTVHFQSFAHSQWPISNEFNIKRTLYTGKSYNIFPSLPLWIENESQVNEQINKSTQSGMGEMQRMYDDLPL